MVFSDLHYVRMPHVHYTLIIHTSYTVPHNHCIMTMIQQITLLYVLTLSLLSAVAPLDSNRVTTSNLPCSAALCSGVLSSYNNNTINKLQQVNATQIRMYVTYVHMCSPIIWKIISRV